MAPPTAIKRLKGIQIIRPFMYGSVARPFHEVHNPKPEGVPEDHTHSWTIYVKGIDDVDITYWCKKVQFKLHESIPQSMRTVEDVPPGTAYSTSATGWGEFDYTLKIHYPPESNEKPQTLFPHLHLHPWGDENTKAAQIAAGEVTAWEYEEQVFNEPTEWFYEVLTNPAPAREKGGKGKGTRVMRGGMVGSVGERGAMIPLTSTPGVPYSRETERGEVRKLVEARRKVAELTEKVQREIRVMDEELMGLRKGRLAEKKT
ncbi:hypothetical protein B7494_g1311 [Chlorociboria aeruginascens]|nr:hypothetical protein B7494_g1311 [Chlorociboria aeruginascens]